MVVLSVFVFGFALWLGLYLVARDITKPLMRRAGIGLIAYACVIAADLVMHSEPYQSLPFGLARFQLLMIFVPALCWSGALICLLPEDAPYRETFDRAWRYGVLPLVGFVALVGSVSGMLTGSPVGQLDLAYLLLCLIVAIPLVSGLILIIYYRRVLRPRVSVGVLVVATFFFGLGLALLLVPLTSLPYSWNRLLIAPDLVLLGLAIAMMDAFDEGETLLPDIARSFTASSLLAILFGVQVLIAMALSADRGRGMVLLLLGVVAMAIAVQVFADPLAMLIDRVIFARAPRLWHSRADLRAVTSGLARVEEDPALPAPNDAEFVRLTRRALSHYGNLPRLAANPLTHLSLVEARLVARGVALNPLERAAELKMILAESIERLKPRDGSEFGTTDAWRYYNALYFPYVVGLKPYSRRVMGGFEDNEINQRAFEWFATMVPERTLYNWQNAGAKLVAEDLGRQCE